MRATYVWRLIVFIPDEYLDPSWVPSLWERNSDCDFSWPRRRNFLTESGAVVAANKLRRYGAFVEIVRSKPVEFEPVDEFSEKRVADSADRLKRVVNPPLTLMPPSTNVRTIQPGEF